MLTEALAEEAKEQPPTQWPPRDQGRGNGPLGADNDAVHGL